MLLREAGKSSQKGFKKGAEAPLSEGVKEKAAGSKGVPLGRPGPADMCTVCVYIHRCACAHKYSCVRRQIKWHVTDLSEKSYKSAISLIPHKQKVKGKRKKKIRTYAIGPDLFLPCSHSEEGGRR